MFLTGNLMALVFTIATFMQFSYSVRTSYRFFLICIATFLLAAIFDYRRRAVSRRQNRRIQTPVAREQAREVKIGQ
jgi:hypothetical protein